MSEELQQNCAASLDGCQHPAWQHVGQRLYVFHPRVHLYKYLSEKIELYANEELKEDGMTFKEAWNSDDEELKADLKEACVQDLGYFVEPEYLYSTIISMIDHKENILPALERSLKRSKTVRSARRARMISAVCFQTSTWHLPNWAKPPMTRTS